jgi:mannose-6-phosphate isomerase-like protein (cupin superfamily)
MRTYKPWGFELLRVNTDQLAVKIIHLDAGQRTSLQYHERKAEVLTVARGTAVVGLYDEKGQILTEHRLTAGMYIHIPAGRIHRTRALELDVSIIEVSTPELDDVVRLEDDYGRL